MENDFLKNLDGGQVREIVDSMYPREFERGSYVIREGDAGNLSFWNEETLQQTNKQTNVSFWFFLFAPGSHLYVSAEGELEVVQGGRVLGRMGPGKAFGELAILYNCTRTASVKGLAHAPFISFFFLLLNQKTDTQRNGQKKEGRNKIWIDIFSLRPPFFSPS